MKKNELVPSELFPAQVSDICKAWLTSEGHSAITGIPANVDGRVGGKFTAWDEYISGSTLELTTDQHSG